MACLFTTTELYRNKAYRPFDSLQSANGRSQLPAPTCGTTFRSTSHLHSHSRSSDSISRLSSLVPIRTSWYDLLIIIDYYHLFFSGIFRWPCNNWYYLDHVKHVDDDDDETPVAKAVSSWRCPFVCLFVCLSPAGGGGLSRWLFGAIDLFSF